MLTKYFLINIHYFILISIHILTLFSQLYILNNLNKFTIYFIEILLKNSRNISFDILHFLS
jgi:hypothetical protein